MYKFGYCLWLILIAAADSYSQERINRFEIRVFFQYEKQEAVIPLGFYPKVEGTAINFGIDVLYRVHIKKISFHGGLGYFRNKINLRRPYDHQALNVGRDSLPIGLAAKDYTYSEMRMPLGFSYSINSNQSRSYNLGIEYLPHFTFMQNYNGNKPFPGANTQASGFFLRAQSINFFLALDKHLPGKGTIGLQPYVRVFYKYQTDEYLYEKLPGNFVKYFDAWGLAISYAFR